jgi:hypothetical protein
MPAFQTASFRKVQAAQNRAPFSARSVLNAPVAHTRAIAVHGQSEGGPFAPLVVVTRNVMGKKEFNKFRGKAISVHSQVGRVLALPPVSQLRMWTARCRSDVMDTVAEYALFCRSLRNFAVPLAQMASKLPR